MMKLPTSMALSAVSKINALPLLNLLSPSASRRYSKEEQEGYLQSQTLAQKCAVEIAGMIQLGWTEEKTAALMETWLRDHGVKSFFHKPFVWWGDRTRFANVKTYWDYLPSKRALCENEVFILDVAPIVDGFVSDIGFSGIMGFNAEYNRALAMLAMLRAELPTLAETCGQGRFLWQTLDRIIKEDGWENIHATYPFGVLGHRLHRNQNTLEATFIHFGWQSYWELISRGLFGQLLNKEFSGDMDGIWAIEPHIGGAGFGVKFEEILVIEQGKARWLGNEPAYHFERTI